MKDVAREFLARLSAEEAHFAERMGLDEIGLGFLTAIKEFDHYHYHLMRHERSEETEQHFHLIRLGLPKLIAGVLSAIPKFTHPVVTFRSDRVLIIGAMEALAAFGFIEQGKRLAHATFAGECEIRRFDDRQYDVVMPDIVFNMEAHEASVEHHYNRLRREKLDEAIKETFGKSGTNERISALLEDNVYAFKDHFIGYDAHPDLDDFFFGMASIELQNENGYDTFNWRLKFGGVTMQKYMLATTYFLSLALKHEKFAEALLAKSPGIRLRDVLTITRPREAFEANLIEALDRWGPSFEGYMSLTQDEARTILRIVSTS